MLRDVCFDVQVVDHSGSAEEGAALIYAQLEKIIKQVHALRHADKLALKRGDFMEYAGNVSSQSDVCGHLLQDACV